MRLRTILGSVALAGGLLLNLNYSLASTEFTKKEKKPCTYCHKAKSAKDATADDLNEAGKYYEKHKTLEGYVPSDKKGKKK
jgi:hypothetical protein